MEFSSTWSLTPKPEEVIYFPQEKEKITLAELGPESTFDVRIVKNLGSVIAAASLSTGGTLLGGLDPSFGGILSGGVLAGVGNGGSTVLVWRKKYEQLIADRVLLDFPKLVVKVSRIHQRIFSSLRR